MEGWLKKNENKAILNSVEVVVEVGVELGNKVCGSKRLKHVGCQKTLFYGAHRFSMNEGSQALNLEKF